MWNFFYYKNVRDRFFGVPEENGSIKGKHDERHSSDRRPYHFSSTQPKSVHDKNHWRMFFEDQMSLTKSKSIFFVLFFGAVITFYVYVLLALSPSSVTLPGNHEKGELQWWLNWNSLVKLLPLIASISASFLAAALTAWMINSSNIARNNSVRHLADDGLLREFFKTLSTYNGRYEAEKEIRIKFLKIAPDANPFGEDINDDKGVPNIIICRLEFSYYTFIDRDSSLEIVFNRGEEGSSLDEDDNGYLDDPLRFIWFYKNLEDGMIKELVKSGTTGERKQIKDKLKDLYKLYDVEIDYDASDINIHRDKDLTKWQIEHGRSLTPDRPVHMFYRIEYPLELEGYNFFSVRFPTRVFKIEIDASEIAEFVDCYPEDLLNSGSVRVRPIKEDKNVIRLGYKGWVLPRSSVLLTRFKKT